MAVRFDHFMQGLGDTDRHIEFYAPALHLESIDNAWSPHSMRWRGDIDMTYTGRSLYDPEVRVGVVKFLMVRTALEGLADELRARHRYDGLPTHLFAPLFDGDVATGIPAHLAESVEVVMIVLQLTVDPALRGHRLGAWALSQVVDTMLPPSTGLVLMLPDASANRHTPAVGGKITDWRHFWWRTAGLEPLDHHREFLAQRTGSIFLDEATEALHRRFYGKSDYLIEVPAQSIRQRIAGGELSAPRIASSGRTMTSKCQALASELQHGPR